MNTPLYDQEAIEGIYSNPQDVYLASGDDIRDVTSSIGQLQNRSCVHIGHTLVSVVGGLGSLNLVPILRPDRILFFDVNPYCLEFARLIIHLITHSDNRLQFLTHYLSRPVSQEPTPENETDILAQPPLSKIWQHTQDKLPSALKDSSRRYLGAIRDARLIGVQLQNSTRGVLHCPAFPNSRFISLCGNPEAGESDMIRSLFVGEGWLANDETYLCTRRTLQNAKIDYETTQLARLPMDELLSARPTYLYASNINGYCPAEWIAALAKWKIRLHSLRQTWPGAELIAITAFDGIVPLSRTPLLEVTCHRSSRAAMQTVWKGPHFTALWRICALLRGDRICEITHKTPYGFSEIPRTNLTISDFLDSSESYHTLIFHTPLAAGICTDDLLQAVRKGVAQGARIIVFDHNPECAEFEAGRTYIEKGTASHEWWTPNDALSQLKAAAGANCNHLITYAAGYRSSVRNWVIALDSQDLQLHPEITAAGCCKWAQALDQSYQRSLVSQLLQNTPEA